MKIYNNNYRNKNKYLNNKLLKKENNQNYKNKYKMNKKNNQK